MELSSIITVEFVALYAILISPVMPLWIKVESPITATFFFSPSLPIILFMPWRAEMEAPIQIVESIELRGAAAPSV